MNKHPYSTLNPEQILDAVESIGYSCDGRITPLNSYENRVYHIGIEDQKPLIVKFYRPNRWSEAQIKEEHQFCFELVDAEWPLAPPIKQKNAESLHQFDGFFLHYLKNKGGMHLNLTI